MPRVVFTPQLRRFTAAPEHACESAGTLRALLDSAFAAHPLLRGYILDEQGHLRPNVVAFVDGQRVLDRQRLDQPLAPTSTVHVLQALSGG
jgi:sulfur-carrier protein